jgi:hypothetical protein
MNNEFIKAIKKRGYYFDNLEKTLSQKHNISRELINEIRRLAIFKKLTQQEICIKITDALQNHTYQVDPHSRYKNLEKLIALRTEVLTYLLRCSPEIFADITQLTKYDWDYQGEDKKVPSKEIWREYLNKGVDN